MRIHGRRGRKSTCATGTTCTVRRACPSTCTTCCDYAPGASANAGRTRHGSRRACSAAVDLRKIQRTREGDRAQDDDVAGYLRRRAETQRVCDRAHRQIPCRPLHEIRPARARCVSAVATRILPLQLRGQILDRRERVRSGTEALGYRLRLGVERLPRPGLHDAAKQPAAGRRRAGNRNGQRLPEFASLPPNERGLHDRNHQAARRGRG